MLRTLTAASLLLAPLALAGCGDPMPPPTSVVVQQAPIQAVPSPDVVVSPLPPPQAQSERMPPPQQGAGGVVWQPGHWRYTGMAGNPWTWDAGVYVAPPQGSTVWTPGRWMQQPSGEWMWMDGHWA